ncbi:Ame1 protein [Maudiozyma humilis]|uniref:Ame1 protein n=1 Tax=Maudiozyma humilis TaxID=51915 RepID=A0AAV5RST1_MAUHU|nr:Ame1 protein [Kazachstania humilis]
MDRHTRMLYRQRGSNLRQTVDEDDVLVIRTPARPAFSPVPTPPVPAHYSPQFDAPPDDGFMDNQDQVQDTGYSHEYEHNLPATGPLEYNDAPRQFPNTNARPPQDYTALSDTQLVTPPTTTRALTALRALSKHIFRDTLAQKARRDASASLGAGGSVPRRLSYRLDAALFEQLQTALDRDLCDIADIHAANNALLLQQVRRAQRRRVLLQRQLVETRAEIAREAAEAAAADTANTTHTGSHGEDTLDSRLQLNRALHALQRRLTSGDDQRAAGPPADNPAEAPSLDSTLRLLDPQHGAVARIAAINARLREQLG